MKRGGRVHRNSTLVDAIDKRLLAKLFAFFFLFFTILFIFYKCINWIFHYLLIYLFFMQQKENVIFICSWFVQRNSHQRRIIQTKMQKIGEKKIKKKKEEGRRIHTQSPIGKSVVHCTCVCVCVWVGYSGWDWLMDDGCN